MSAILHADQAINLENCGQENWCSWASFPSENKEGKKGVVPEISGHELLLLLKLVDFPLCTSVPPNLLVARIAPLYKSVADLDLYLVSPVPCRTGL